MNNINDFSKKPGTVTKAASNRVEQFTRWFIRIFNVWYVDVTEASDKEARECLTNNFPYDSPGNLDQEGAFIIIMSNLNSQQSISTSID